MSGNTLSHRRPSIAAARAGTTYNDRYLFWLACVLLGYALFGKGFAYLGIPPLYVGEIALLLGLLAALRSGCLVAFAGTSRSKTIS